MEAGEARPCHAAWARPWQGETLPRSMLSFVCALCLIEPATQLSLVCALCLIEPARYPRSRVPAEIPPLEDAG